jgi:WD40 repeat protein
VATPLLAGDPRQLGSFYLDGRLGAGGFGVVYEGYGADGGRVAVKTLHRVEHGDRDLLREEVRAWLLVEPVCIAKVLQVDFDGPIPFVVSEHVAGPDLQEAVNRNGPYEPEELRRLAVGVAAALVAVGQAGVVHRDVKPANVLLGADGPRGIDFGIARIGALPSTNGVVKGTLRYMPPERYRGERGDAKVDVWAWGAVVWFAANGHHAFGGRSLPEIHHQVVTHEPDTSMLEEPLRSLVAAALSKDPAHRPTARELLSELTGGTDPVAAAAQAVPTRAPEVAAPPRGEVAEAVFARLDPREQEAVPAVLLRMVASGERAEDTLRSAHRSEFADDRTDPQVLERVLGAFTDAGILVWQEETATLCSAALVRAWPRLREWVRTERQSLGTHQSIAAASRRWEEHGRKNSDLYQGTALADALSWASRGRRHLTPNHAERAFLDAGAALERRRGRRRTVLSAVLAVLLVVAVGAAAVAVDRGRNLERQRDRAASAQVAGLAQSLRRTNPELARRLAVAAAGLADTPESRSGLLALRHQWEDQAVKLPDFEVTASDLDATARVLGVAGGAVGRGSVQVEFWNLDTRKRISSYTAASAVGDIALSGDGRTAAVTTGDGRTRLIDTAAGRPRDARTYPSARGQYGPVVKLSPLGTYLLVGELAKDSDGRDVRVLAVWDTRRAKKVLTASGGMFPDVNASVSPDERIISVPVSSGKGRPFTWIDTRSGKKLPVPGLDLEPGDAQGPVTFSTDGRLAAVKIDGGKIQVFDRNGTGYPDHLLSNTNPDSSHPLTFSKDGRYFAQGAFVWDTRALYNPPIMRYPTPQGECHPDEGGLRLTAEASELRCVGGDGVFRSLDISVFTKARVLAEGRPYGTSGVNEDRTAVGLKRGALLELWSTRTWTNRATWDASEHRARSRSVPTRACSPVSPRSAPRSRSGTWPGRPGSAPSPPRCWDSGRRGRIWTSRSRRTADRWRSTPSRPTETTLWRSGT